MPKTDILSTFGDTGVTMASIWRRGTYFKHSKTLPAWAFPSASLRSSKVNSRSSSRLVNLFSGKCLWKLTIVAKLMNLTDPGRV